MNAAEKIRADDQIAKTITVFIRTSPFDKNKKYYSNSKTIDLAIPSSNSIELIKNAIKALTDIYKYGYSYQKAGIILSGLKDANQNDQNLLTPLLENKSKKLMKAIDYTNTKYGRYAISIAQAGLSKGWKMRREHSSKIDTASFDSLPKIRVYRNNGVSKRLRLNPRNLTGNSVREIWKKHTYQYKHQYR